MKITKKHIVYLFMAILTLLVGYEHSEVKDFDIGYKPLKKIDSTNIEMYYKKIKVDNNISKFWNISIDSKEDLANKNEELNTTVNIEKLDVTKEKDKNVLCIVSSCYRLLGIHYSKNKPTITMYNKDLKEKVKDYYINDSLEYSIQIESIVGNKVVIKDLDTDRKWTFELFDVNTTKYKPEEVSEIDE